MKRKPSVICCYADLHPRTEELVRKHADAQFIDVSSSEDAYWEAIKKNWTGKRDLIVIEQDMEITADVVPSFSSCDQDWCVYSYQGPSQLGYLYRSLGCTRFSRRLQKKIKAEDFEYPLPYYAPDTPHWQLLDAILMRMIWGRHRIPVHVHGHLQHFHTYDEIYPIAMERQPSGDVWIYKNNPDGTRSDEIINKRTLPDIDKSRW